MAKSVMTIDASLDGCRPAQNDILWSWDRIENHWAELLK